MVAPGSPGTLAVPAAGAMKWLADENFDNGILRRSPGFGVVPAQDVPPIAGQEDVVCSRGQPGMVELP